MSDEAEYCWFCECNCLQQNDADGMDCTCEPHRACPGCADDCAGEVPDDWDGRGEDI